MPQFNALEALDLLKRTDLDIPFIIISGTVGEVAAVEAMRAGANDYLMKDNLVRLTATIERELEEAENRRARRRAEEALKASETELRTLFAAMNDVILVLDAEGRYLKIAPTDPAYFYKPPDSLLGKKLADVFPKTQADFFLEYIRRALDEGRMLRVEYSLQVGQREVWFDGIVSPINDHSVIWIARDITERKRADDEKAKLTAQIANQRERLNTIIANIPGMVWEAWGEPAVLNQRTDFVSDYVETMLGYSREEWLTTPNIWFSIVHEDDKERTSRAIDANFAARQAGTLEFRWIAKDGRVVWAGTQYLIITDGEGKPIGIRGVTIDITERKRAEEALRESEERYKGLVDSAFDGVVIHQDLTIVSANRAYAEMFGYTVDELVGRKVLDLTPPEHRDFVFSKISSEQALYETIGLRKDGTHINIEISSKDCVYEGERARLAAVRDITERKRAETQLRFQKSLLESQTEAALDGILVASTRGDILYFNKHFAELWNIPEHVLRTHSDKAALDYVLDQLPDPQEFLAGIEHLYEHPTEESHDEIPLKDGRTFDRYSAPIKSDENEYYGRVWFFRDITERKQAEEKLRRQLDFTEAITTSMGEGIYALDERGRVTLMNPAAEATLGWTAGELLGQRMHDVVHFRYEDGTHRPKNECPLLGVIDSGKTIAIDDDVFTRKDGSIFHVSYTSSPIVSEDRIVGAVLTFRDITERRLLEAQLQQSQKMEAIGQLAGGVAHDFNNLLTAINGYSSLALRRTDAHEPIKGYLEEIKKAGDRAANLTRQLLAFGRKQMLQPIALNLNDVIADINKMLRRLIGEDIRLRAKLDPSLRRIKADPGQIEQVIVNLAVNARDAMPNGGDLTIETANFEADCDYATTHIGIAPGSYVMLAVSDNGIGMDEHTKARIFEPFFTTKEKGRGTGLGLSTVYGIVKQSGGNIWVYSEVNQGAVFKVYLPRLVDASEPEIEIAEEAGSEAGGSETILLVEDEDVVRGLAREVLEHAGYEVLEASSGKEAIRLCNDENHTAINLLLTDVVMPEMSGPELAKRLTLLRPGIRVLFMSGYTDEAIVQHGIVDSNVEFFSKPFSPALLTRKVREVLDLKSS
jgi:PAS domain S-box-containing protein